MGEIQNLLLIAVGSAFVNNVVLSQFLGICPFLGVSKNVKTAAGMGGAVVFVITIASFVTGLIYKFILGNPNIMGGELDSTNVIDPPECAVITALGMDHVKELGPTLADIARAKAGIIKPGSPVVSYGGAPEADAVIEQTAAQQGAPLTAVDFSRLRVGEGSLEAVPFGIDGLEGLRLPLVGSYQPRNAAVAITALRVLRTRGWTIPDEAIRQGLAGVRWPGRFEVLREQPVFLLDGSHNAHGMRATVESLRARLPGQKPVFLLSIVADKDVDEMLRLLLPLAEGFVTVAAHTPRALPAEELAERIRALGGRAQPADGIPEGVRQAVEWAGEGPVCALGTLYFSGEVRQAFKELSKTK